MKDRIFSITTVILFLFLGWLVFANLLDHVLWNDEASVAVTARNAVQFGYPRSFDGLNYIYPYLPEFNWPGTYIFIADPWLPIYVVASSFKLLGISTWSARLPFVMAGFFTLILLYLFCIRYLVSKKIGILSILLLGTSVPFLLHTRQARYYGLLILLCVTIFYLYHRILEQKKGYFWFSFSSLLLVLTNHAVFVPMFGGIWLQALIMDRKRIEWRKFIAISIVPLLSFAAWTVVSLVGGMTNADHFPMNSSLLAIKKNLEFQTRTINGYFVPIAFWIVVIILFRVFKKQSVILPSRKEAKIFKRIALLLGCNIVFFTIFGLRTMRYYVQYLPFLCLLEAFLLSRIFQWKKMLGVVILSLVIFTNFLARPNPLFLTKGLPAPLDVSKHSKFRTYFLNYLYELTHEYTGPLEALCKYLDLHAKPGERIKIVKGDLTVMFYHPELVILNDARYFKKTFPEWIVIRKYWNPIFTKIWREELGAEIEDGYLDVLDRYDKIPLPAVDSIRENVPHNLEQHFFKSPEITPENQMFVYRLRED